MQFQRLNPQDGEIPRRLIEAAAAAFARHGYAGTRIREIVRAADVNIASVNYYFGGKEGLYAATLSELAAAREGEYPPAPGAREAPEEALYRHVLRVLRRYADGRGDARLGRILAHESMDPTPYFDPLIEQIVQPDVERLEAPIARLAGGRLSATQLRATALSVLGQCLFYLFARGALGRLAPGATGTPERCEALARHITDFSVAGIAAAGRHD